MKPLSPRSRRLALHVSRAGALLSAGMFLVAAAGVVGALPTGSPSAGAVTLTPASGNSGTTFSLGFTSSPQRCPGDNPTGGYLWSTFITPATTDVATMTYDPSGAAQGPAFTSNLRNTGGQPIAGEAPSIQQGLISPPTGLSFSSTSFAGLTPGQYLVGIACIKPDDNFVNQTEKFWATPITITASTGAGPRNFTYDASSTTTTTTTAATTTTAPATTTTTSAAATTTTRPATTTTTTSVATSTTTTTVPSTSSSTSTTLTTPGGNIRLSVRGGTLKAFTTATPRVAAPAGYTLPWGELTFSANTTPGTLVTFSMALNTAPSTYFKLRNNAWGGLPFDGETGVVLNDTSLTVTIRDNGRGDDDPTAGVVQDPGAPAVTTTSTTTTTTTSVPSSGGGSSAGSGGSGGDGFDSGAGALAASGTSSAIPLAVWAFLFVAFGRMAILLGRTPKVLPAATT